MLLFAGAGLGGSGWAFDRIVLERSLYDRGLVTNGVLLRKTIVDGHTSPSTSSDTVYNLTYRFDGGTGPIESQNRVSSSMYFSVEPGESLPIRYLPDRPQRNLPDGSHLSNLFWIFAIFSFIIGLGASVVVVGMTVTKIRGDRTNFEKANDKFM